MAVEPALLVGLGGVVGLIMALTGAGGGALAVPLLIFGAGLSLQQAAPISLTAVGLSALLGAGLGLREGVVRYRAALLIGGVGVLAAPLGVTLAQRLPPTPLLLAFAAFLLLTAWRMTRPAGSSPRPAQPVCFRPDGERQLRWTPRCAAVMGSLGAGAGLLSGLLGVGGGFLIVPTLERRTNLDFANIQATSLGVMALVASSGLASAALHGSLAGAMALPFAAGAVGGLLLGRRLSRHVPAARLRQVFAVVAVAVAGLMLERASRL
ncbi:sulfite exporter TauE/SafE family protein [Inhella gelatinilytica]|uniref:Probable membrane transporter protein n=1 Tax=Inhella gelatinilytica TaxID=2795030 RepID=A0A931IWE7_9BURK|nr:sulfite exporter TauE/SafE family protein [Inhella gelatinilytica]MBH9551863.1 sulfite exporter TauE/SafE family protein [Inhella gelatinilytica]